MVISRRTILKTLGSAGAIPFRGVSAYADQPAALSVAGRPVEVWITPIDPHIVRVSMVPMDEGRPQPIPSDGSLVRRSRQGRKDLVLLRES